MEANKSPEHLETKGFDAISSKRVCFLCLKKKIGHAGAKGRPSWTRLVTPEMLHFRQILQANSKQSCLFDQEAAIAVGSSANVHPSCFKKFNKWSVRSSAPALRAQSENKVCTPDSDTDAPMNPPIPSLREMADTAQKSKWKALSKYTGPFTYQHQPVPLDTLSPDSKAANEKCLYTLLQQRISGGKEVVKVRNANPSNRPLTFLKVTAKIKKEGLSKTGAKRRVRSLLEAAEITGADKSVLKSGCSKKKARVLHEAIAPAAGINIQPFIPEELASLQTKLGISRKLQRLLTKALISKVGAYIVEGGACSESRVEAVKLAEEIAKYKFGISKVYEKRDSSEVLVETPHVVLENFDEAFAAFTANTDNTDMYETVGCHKPKVRLLVVGGDTGGKQNFFKWGWTDTHVKNCNSGKKWRVWYMVRNFQETYRNFSLTMTQLIGQQQDSLFKGEKELFRLRQTRSLEGGDNRSFSSCVTSCAKFESEFRLDFVHTYDINVDGKVCFGPKRISNFSWNCTRSRALVIDGFVIWRFFGIKKENTIHSLISIQLSSSDAAYIISKELLYTQSWAEMHANFDSYIKSTTPQEGEWFSFQKSNSRPVMMINMELFPVPFQVIEVSLFFGEPLKYTLQDKQSTLDISHQLLQPLLNGDMKCVYTILGHNANFLRDVFKCIFCTHNFQTGDSGEPRNIHDFHALSQLHTLNPTDSSLHFDIVNEPLIPLSSLAVVVPFMLHMFLGIFQRTILCFRRSCRALDLKLPHNIRAPEDLERLEQKLQEAVQNKEITANICQQTELELEGATEEYEALNIQLREVHANWSWKNSIQTVKNSSNLTQEELDEFVALRADGIAAKEALAVLTKRLDLEKKKNKTDADKVKLISQEIIKLAGPLEKKCNQTLEKTLGMTGNLWWGDYVGPDMVKFFNDHPSTRTAAIPKKSFEILIAEMHKHLLENKLFDGLNDELTATRATFVEFSSMWVHLGQLYFAVKHVGHQTIEKISEIQQKRDLFCPLFERLCVLGDKEPTPKFHCLKKHLISFMQSWELSWRGAEEAGEAVHHLVTEHTMRNAKQHGDKNKLLGTMKTFMHECSFKLEKKAEEFEVLGARRKRKPKRYDDI